MFEKMQKVSYMINIGLKCWLLAFSWKTDQTIEEFHPF